MKCISHTATHILPKQQNITCLPDTAKNKKYDMYLPQTTRVQVVWYDLPCDKKHDMYLKRTAREPKVCKGGGSAYMFR